MIELQMVLTIIFMMIPMTALKMLAVWQTDDQEGELQIIPPSAGYYTNIRMQYLSNSAEDPCVFWMGTDLSKQVRDDLITSEALLVNPDIYKNAH